MWNAEDGFAVPADAENADGLNFLAGKTMNHVNQKAHDGTVLAHTDGRRSESFDYADLTPAPVILAILCISLKRRAPCPAIC